MKRMPDDNFLKPLKNRPGLIPRQEFKREVEAKLRGLEIKKHKFQLIKGPLLLGMAFLLIFAIFSDEIVDQFNFGTGERNTAILDRNEDNNPAGKYISKNEAIAIAKKNAQSDIISWDADFIKDPLLLGITELENNPNPIWKVAGTYPMGNKDIFYIDSVTGDQLAMGEEEREGFAEAADDFIEIKEVKDHLDHDTYVYNGEIILSLSEKAKIELENGTLIIVSISGEESSFSLKPVQIVNPKNEESVPFEIDLDSIGRNHKLLGSLKLFIELKDELGVTIYKKEVKALEVE
ncbi:PepSY domain-containing protein [Neobacillus sp. D3-1R]|uniref:PepSY domain-containing protein n=1 Tax=Neobacillus sp. D3-1R TaxID=3445778 RepID=UPI003FA021B3